MPTELNKDSKLKFKKILHSPFDGEPVDEITRHKEDDQGEFTTETRENGARSPMYSSPERGIFAEERAPTQLPSGQIIEYDVKTLSKA